MKSVLVSPKRTRPLCSRKPLITIVLYACQYRYCRGLTRTNRTYTPPNKNITNIPIFFAHVICNLATSYRGSARMKTSMIILGTALPRNRSNLFIHFVYATAEKVQRPYSGWHWRNVTSVTASHQRITIVPRTKVPLFTAEVGNKLRYIARTESLIKAINTA